MKRNKHSLSHTRLLSLDMGLLVPIGLTEVLPGDTIQQATSALIRTQPLLAPIMHPVHVRIHHWFVPHRLVWDEWEDFITAGPQGTSTPSLPWRSLPAGIAQGSLWDYYGVPPGGTNVVLNMLAMRGYNLIWNEWYRDQDLQTPLTISTVSGNDTTTPVAVMNINWEKDYFTSSRPFEQKGPAITIPIGTRAPVRGIGTVDGTATSTLAAFRETTGALMTGQFGVGMSGASAIKTQSSANTGSGNTIDVYADLAGASAVTVNALRQALALQRFEEARARYGSRYVEYLRYLGIRSSDARMQRPEYLGGGKQTIQFSEVLQSAADGANPVGTMRGHGIGAMRSNRYRRFIEEHGYIHSFISIRPKTMYMNGIPRTWIKRNKEDFWQKELEHIGQQIVQKREVYVGSASPESTFGHQDRYDEYRRAESGVSGEFRSSLLNFWHMARDFGSEPSLNSAFVQCVPTERNFPTPAQNIVYAMVKHSIQARRLVAAKGTSFIY